MSQELDVRPSGFYAWRNRAEKARRGRDALLLTHIRVAHKASHQTCASTRVHRELIASGVKASRHRVARLMSANGFIGVRKKRYIRTTQSHHNLAIASDLLKRDLSATGPNQKWVTDITYLRTADGWAFLAAIIGLFSRRFVGWSMADHMGVDLPLAALRKAFDARKPGPGLIHHSDRGCQYCSASYQPALATADIECSMNRKGECWDNSVAEIFFGRLKEELVYRVVWQSRPEIMAVVESYISRFYNTERRHFSLAYCSLIDYEIRAARNSLAA